MVKGCKNALLKNKWIQRGLRHFARFSDHHSAYQAIIVLAYLLAVSYRFRCCIFFHDRYNPISIARSTAPTQYLRVHYCEAWFTTFFSRSTLKTIVGDNCSKFRIWDIHWRANSLCYVKLVTHFISFLFRNHFYLEQILSSKNVDWEKWVKNNLIM